MPDAMTMVPTGDLNDLTMAVERLRSLGAESRVSAPQSDPLCLFDALCDVYAASQRLVGVSPPATPGSPPATPPGSVD